MVPDVLRVRSSTPSYFRAATVFDVQQGEAEVRLGGGTLFRVALRQTVQGGDLEMSPARGHRLRIEIEDGDSPALESVDVAAVVRQPVLFFALPARGVEVAGVLRYGGGRVDRARYDLDRLSPTESAVRGQVARLGSMLLDQSQTRLAELRDLRPNPAFDLSPLLAFAMHPGAAVNVADFSHRRAVHVGASADGLVRLRLRPEDLAVARPDLSDVRIVDGDGRQWPYLLHRGAGVAWVDLAVAPVVRAKNVSRTDLGLPQAPLPIESVELGIDAPFFNRDFRLVEKAGAGGERVLAHGTLSRSARQPMPALIAVPAGGVAKISLTVDDGDEAPLPIRSARASVRVPDVYLIAPEGEYWLLVGNADARAPRYDLAEARNAVLAVSSEIASAGPLEVNRAYGWRQRLFAGDRRALFQQVAVWAVLGVAVIALALVTVRLVRRVRVGPAAQVG